MWWNWKKEKSTTGVLVVRARTNHSAMALTEELNSNHCFSVPKKPAKPICAVARTQRIRHFAMAPTEISDQLPGKGIGWIKFASFQGGLHLRKRLYENAAASVFSCIAYLPGRPLKEE